jgi:hypothetical protein
MQMQASGEDMPPDVEFWNQDRVPEINVRVAGFDCRRSAHDQDTRLNSCGHEAAQESP